MIHLTFCFSQVIQPPTIPCFKTPLCLIVKRFNNHCFHWFIAKYYPFKLPLAASDSDSPWLFFNDLLISPQPSNGRAGSSAQRKGSRHARSVRKDSICRWDPLGAGWLGNFPWLNNAKPSVDCCINRLIFSPCLASGYLLLSSLLYPWSDLTEIEDNVCPHRGKMYDVQLNVFVQG